MTDSNSGKSIEELRYEVAETRQKVQADVSALSRKVSPENLKEEGKLMMKEQAHNAKVAVQHGVQERGERAAAAVRRDPIPTMLVGAGLVGLGWWVYSRRQPTPVLNPAQGNAGESVTRMKTRAQGSIASARETARGRVQATQDRAREAASDVGDRAKGYAQRSKLQAKRGVEAGKSFVEENPLAAGAIALAAGFGLAALLPRTRWEDETIGPQRDKLLDEANRQLSTAADVATAGAREMISTAEQEGSALADETKDAAKTVAQAGRDAAQRSARQNGISSGPN